MSTDSQLIVASEVQHEPQPRSLISDLRRAAMSLPVEQQRAALEEYADRRKSLRDWLKEQLVEGVHFGIPPGCEPKINDKGEYGVWDKRASRYNWYPPEQWQPKPSLYKAGAEFVVDLMGLRPTYSADEIGWKQLGSVAGMFVYSCELFSRETGELIGEGRGVRQVGQKGGDANNGIKMAMKSALVCAVLNAYGLSDLFTQDLEDKDLPPTANEAPGQRNDAPRASTRSTRITSKQMEEALKRWGTLHDDERDSPKWREYWASFCYRATGENFDVMKSGNWDAIKFQQLCDLLTKEEGGAPPDSVPTPEECAAQQSDLPF